MQADQIAETTIENASTIWGGTFYEILALKGASASKTGVSETVSLRDAAEGHNGTLLNIHTGFSMDGTDGDMDFFVVDANSHTAIDNFNAMEDVVSVASDTLHETDIHSRLEKTGLYLSWDDGSIFLEGFNEAPTSQDTWFKVQHSADLNAFHREKVVGNAADDDTLSSAESDIILGDTALAALFVVSVLGVVTLGKRFLKSSP